MISPERKKLALSLAMITDYESRCVYILRRLCVYIKSYARVLLTYTIYTLLHLLLRSKFSFMIYFADLVILISLFLSDKIKIDV